MYEYIDTTNDNAMYKRGEISPKCPTDIVYTNAFRNHLDAKRKNHRLHYHMIIDTEGEGKKRID